MWQGHVCGKPPNLEALFQAGQIDGAQSEHQQTAQAGASCLARLSAEEQGQEEGN